MQEETLTVGELKEYLKNNFSPGDKLCYWHEGGAWMECEPVYRADLGRNFLIRVSDDKSRRFADGKVPEDCLEDYASVDDDYVIIY